MKTIYVVLFLKAAYTYFAFDLTQKDFFLYQDDMARCGLKKLLHMWPC